MSNSYAYIVYGVLVNARVTDNTDFSSVDESQLYTVVDTIEKYGVKPYVHYEDSVIGYIRSCTADIHDELGPTKLNIKQFAADHPNWDEAIKKYCSYNSIKYSKPAWYTIVVNEETIEEAEADDQEQLDTIDDFSEEE